MLAARVNQEGFRVPYLFLEEKPAVRTSGPLLALLFSLVVWCLLGLIAFGVYAFA